MYCGYNERTPYRKPYDRNYQKKERDKEINMTELELIADKQIKQIKRKHLNKI